MVVFIVLFFSCIASLGYCQLQYLLFLLLCATVAVRGFCLDSDSLSGMKKKMKFKFKIKIR